MSYSEFSDATGMGILLAQSAAFDLEHSLTVHTHLSLKQLAGFAVK